MRGPFPFELGLFFFLGLTGYLITGILLRERDRGEATGGPWRGAGLKNFHIRRGMRILAPYYTAVALAWIFWAPDVHTALPWYLAHLTNFHFAMVGWVDYTSHFWSLAVQQQFYLLWPLLIWWLPKRWLAVVMGLIALTAPAFRMFGENWFPAVQIPSLLPFGACDYLALGSLLALAVHRGMPLGHRGLRLASWVAFAGYLVLYSLYKADIYIPYAGAFQQTLLAVAFCGLIAAASRGFGGWRGTLLDHRAIQYIGKLSYSLYLYHNLAPLVASRVLPWLWHPPFGQTWGGLASQGMVIVGFTWLLSWLSWRYIEVPTQRAKARLNQAA